MKRTILTLIVALFSIVMVAQLNSGDKVFVIFKETKGEVNSNDTAAIKDLRSYLEDKSTLIIVDSADDADFTFILSVYQINMGNRKGKVDIIDSKSKKMIFESKWEKGTGSISYRWNHSLHAMSKIFRKQIFKEYPAIEKQE